MGKKVIDGKLAVDELIAKLPQPQQAEVQALREIILEAEPGLTEQVKWNAPSFCQDGDDRITFNMTGKGFIRIVFHMGAKKLPVKLESHLIEDPAGLLQWPANERAILTLSGMAEIREKENALKQLVTDWLAASRKLLSEA